MNKNIKLITAAMSIVFVAGAALPVFAVNVGVNASASVNVGGGMNTQTGVDAKVRANELSANLATRIANAKERADQEIARRLNALNALETRIDGMTRIPTSTRVSLVAEIQAQIAALNALQVKIAADASANASSSLKADIQSIAKSHRIFALIIPQGVIQAAAGRIMGVATTLTTLEGKLQTRINAAQTAGADMSASVAALADMNAKIAAANANAQAAISVVMALKPDNGDQALMRANTQALQDARAKIVDAQHDLNTARQDARTIMVALVQLNAGANASSSVSASTSVQ